MVCMVALFAQKSCMPLSKEKYRQYAKSYEVEKRSGKRRKEPETLEAALAELREMRALVVKMRKRIWYLENKEKADSRQRSRRSGTFNLLAKAGLQALSKHTTE